MVVVFKEKVLCFKRMLQVTGYKLQVVMCCR